MSRRNLFLGRIDVLLRVSIIRGMFDRVGVDVYYVTAKYVEGVEVIGRSCRLFFGEIVTQS